MNDYLLRGSKDMSSFHEPIVLKQNKTKRFTVFLFLSVILLLLTGRGLLESYIPKQVAYIAQLVAAIILVLFLSGKSNPVKSNQRWGNFVALALVLFSGLASVMFTVSSWPGLATYTSALLYLATALFILSVIVFTTTNERTAPIGELVLAPILFVGSLQILAATMQSLFGWHDLPGIDFGSFQGSVRPAGLSGSYLHYPLILTVFFIIILGLWFRLRKVYLIAFAAIFCSFTLFSMSRSGMMILAMMLIFGFFMGRKTIWKFFIALGSVIFLILMDLSERENPILERALSALDLGSSGNSGRVELWTNGLDTWIDSPVLFGTHMGLFTNVTKNFGGQTLGVVESSLIQQMLNFGLIGALATYWILFSIFRAVDKQDAWVRAGVLACIAQTLIYQSIEVLPFMVVLAIIPLIFPRVVKTNVTDSTHLPKSLTKANL